MKEKKKVTFPIHNEDIFRTLAEFAYEVEMDGRTKRNPIDKEEFISSTMNHLATDAFMHSFTPSGEIGDNPRAPRIADSFYDSINDLIGPNGKVTKILKNPTNSAVTKNRMHRFKASNINLIQLYLDAAMGFTTNDRPASDRASKRDRNTSFNYKKSSKNKDDESRYDNLIEVETNRYTRIFVAIFFYTVICDLFVTPIDQMAKVIKDNDLLGVDGIQDKKRIFAILRNDATRRKFIEKVRNLWTIEVKAKKHVEKLGRPKKEKFPDTQSVMPGIDDVKKEDDE